MNGLVGPNDGQSITAKLLIVITPLGAFSRSWGIRMQVTQESLRARYAEMETEQLVELDQNSDLTQTAKTVLQEILSQRGVATAQRIEIARQLEREANSYVPLASPLTRALAQILDGGIALTLFFISLTIAGPYGLGQTLAALAAYVGYLLFQDALPNGQSLGKRILHIRVIHKSSRKPCGPWGSLVRNVFLVFLGPIDLLFMGTRYKQRLGDWVANTMVVNI